MRRHARTFFLSPRGAIVGGIAVLAILFWIVAIEPAVVSFALALAVATAWCLWLERHS